MRCCRRSRLRPPSRPLAGQGLVSVPSNIALARSCRCPSQPCVHAQAAHPRGCLASGRPQYDWPHITSPQSLHQRPHNRPSFVAVLWSRQRPDGPTSRGRRVDTLAMRNTRRWPLLLPQVTIIEWRQASTDVRNGTKSKPRGVEQDVTRTVC